jgi:hypothetical protein
MKKKVFKAGILEKKRKNWGKNLFTHDSTIPTFHLNFLEFLQGKIKGVATCNWLSV